MSSLVSEAIQTELGAIERWPDDVQFFQQYQVEQITLPDQAACLSVKTFLHMCGLNYREELRTNAEEMSPSGKVPFIKVGPFLTSEFDPIVAFVNQRGFSISEHLDDAQRSDMKAYIAMVDNILVNAELYLSWVIPDVLNEVTIPRYGIAQPQPLSWLLPRLKQRDIKTRLNSVGWAKKTFDEVCDEVVTCCQALSDRLGTNPYFFGEKPTELDSLVFGHLFTIITTELPEMRIANIIRRFETLTKFCTNVDKLYRDFSAD
ncbi:metaxin-2-like isoform X1 [Argopecten irradians]|uniref:metaxin-2-like isoform X1 n=1 Tax=Argopecten irradians TaxID=31199 RepID=UPI0037139931